MVGGSVTFPPPPAKIINLSVGGLGRFGRFQSLFFLGGGSFCNIFFLKDVKIGQKNCEFFANTKKKLQGESSVEPRPPRTGRWLDGFRANIHQNQKLDKTFIIPDNRSVTRVQYGRGDVPRLILEVRGMVKIRYFPNFQNFIRDHYLFLPLVLNIPKTIPHSSYGRNYG